MLSAPLGSTQAAKFGSIQTYTVGATKIWYGAIVVIHLTDGFVYPAVEDVPDSLKQLVLGFAMETAEPTKTIRVRCSDGKYKLQYPGVTPDMIGKLAMAVDDETVQIYNDANGKIVVGRITEIKTEGLEVFVDLTDKPVRIASNLYQ